MKIISSFLVYVVLIISLRILFSGIILFEIQDKVQNCIYK